MDYISELGKFLSESLSNWGNLVTGGLLVGLLWLYGIVSKKDIPRRVSLVVAAIFLFLAMFHAWREQFHTAKEKQAVIDYLSKPEFVMTVPGARVIYVPELNETVIALIVAIINKGADSTVTHYVVHYQTPKGRSDLYPVMLSYPLSVVHKNFRYSLANEDSLVYKLQFNTAIKRGAEVSGRLFVVLPGDRQAEFDDSKTIVSVTVKDYLGQEVTAVDQAGPTGEEPVGLPGEKAEPILATPPPPKKKAR